MLERVLGGHDSDRHDESGARGDRLLVRRLGRLLDALPSEGPQPDDIRELQQALYGLYAILRLHFAQENEGYFSLLDADETLPSSVSRVASKPSGPRTLRGVDMSGVAVT